MDELNEPIDISLSHLHEESNEFQDQLISKPVEAHVYYEEIELNERQKYVMGQMMAGFNLFITGASGTGKSELIGPLVRKLRANGDRVAVTSSNQMGAISIGGQTIHKFCGLRKLDDEWANIKKEAQLEYVQNIWSGISVLILDDVSGLTPSAFRKLLYVSQNARKQKTSIQWILIGDFLSLAPYGIKPTDAHDKDEPEFCFQLPEWDKLIHKTIVLTEDYRHDPSIQSEHHFRKILDDIRIGAPNQMKWAPLIQERLNRPFDGTQPFTKLYPKSEAVQSENERNLKQLRTHEFTYHCQKGYQVGHEVCPLSVPKSRQHLNKDVLRIVEKFSINEFKRKKLLDSLLQNASVDSKIVLKAGAFVILMCNLNFKYGLTRGAQGIVIGFTATEPRYPIVQFKQCSCVIRSYMWTVNYTDMTKLWYAQIPLRLGWAFNLHRMRGMTLDRVEVNMRDMFGYGQVYDVLSKVRSLDGINFTCVSWSAIKAHPACVEFYDDHQTEWENEFRKWSPKNEEDTKPVPFNVHDNIPKTAFHLGSGNNILDDRGGKRHQIEDDKYDTLSQSKRSRISEGSFEHDHDISVDHELD